MSGGDVRVAHGLLRSLGFAVSLTERQNETYGETTRNAVGRFQADNGLVVSGSIDSPTYAALKRKADQTAVPNSYSVHGTVRDSDGTPRAGISVRVVDVDFRSETALGEATTGNVK
ncbi:MAG TPA: peptidoglycan-binding domain-containing protein [Bradyrhizobium sp.]|nr:peptidoglycan-binding domain-containing protein [Bradyrhizobium sp.]